jgi:hypothetical protein
MHPLVLVQVAEPLGGEDGKIRLSELRQFIERRELDLRQPK